MTSVNKYSFPLHGWIGLALVFVFWILNWSLHGLRTHFLFFPLWLGYALTMDALAYRSSGNSLLTRSRRKYVSLFVISIPAWWLFELINLRTENWLYLGREQFPDWEYALFSSLSFSTVMPAVFGTAEWVSTWSWIQKRGIGPVYGQTPGEIRTIFILGWLMLALLIIWPRYCFPFVWISVCFILDPINFRMGKRSLIGFVRKGNWRPIRTLWVGSLICGFFWEMWNFYAYPKWTYQVPFVDFPHIFEMPLLGFLGYLPFSMELFALYHLVMPADDDYLLPTESAAGID
ncbi:MAG: hypothetical protein K9N10_05725 [Deltaproteobacteria bacterium]|nr:hypothetical protein [Deltaproteobacteria bacterium]